MNRYLQTRAEKKLKPRPTGRIARGLRYCRNAVFFCIWNHKNLPEDVKEEAHRGASDIKLAALEDEKFTHTIIQSSKETKDKIKKEQDGSSDNTSVDGSLKHHPLQAIRVQSFEDIVHHDMDEELAPNSLLCVAFGSGVNLFQGNIGNDDDQKVSQANVLVDEQRVASNKDGNHEMTSSDTVSDHDQDCPISVAVNGRTGHPPGQPEEGEKEEEDVVVVEKEEVKEHEETEEEEKKEEDVVVVAEEEVTDNKANHEMTSSDTDHDQDRLISVAVNGRTGHPPGQPWQPMANLSYQEEKDQLSAPVSDVDLVLDDTENTSDVPHSGKKEVEKVEMEKEEETDDDDDDEDDYYIMDRFIGEIDSTEEEEDERVAETEEEEEPDNDDDDDDYDDEDDYYYLSDDTDNQSVVADFELPWDDVEVYYSPVIDSAEVDEEDVDQELAEEDVTSTELTAADLTELFNGSVRDLDGTQLSREEYHEYNGIMDRFLGEIDSTDDEEDEFYIYQNVV